MDPISVTASIIAVIQLSSKLLSVCFKYSQCVVGARTDIERLKDSIESLNIALIEVNQLLNGPDGERLKSSHKLAKYLLDCSLLLDSLDRKTEAGKHQKLMRRIGMRALKWPFDAKEIDKIIKDLADGRETIHLALQADVV